MKDDELKELEARYRNWTTEELLRATTVDKEDYQPESIELMIKELDKRNIPHLEKEEIKTRVEKKIEKETKSISGIKGFLLLFLIVLIGNSIFALVTSVSPEVNFNIFASIFFALPFLGIGIYGIFTFFLLIRKKTTAPKHAIMWLISTFIFNVIIEIVYYLASEEIEFSLVASTISSLIWLSYFSQSKRVAATYGTEHKRD
jgi:hypothetical protein